MPLWLLRLEGWNAREALIQREAARDLSSIGAEDDGREDRGDPGGEDCAKHKDLRAEGDQTDGPGERAFGRDMADLRDH